MKYIQSHHDGHLLCWGQGGAMFQRSRYSSHYKLRATSEWYADMTSSPPTMFRGRGQRLPLGVEPLGLDRQVRMAYLPLLTLKKKKILYYKPIIFFVTFNKKYKLYSFKK